MTISLFIFSNKRWVEKQSFGESDVVLVLSAEDKCLYLWEGPMCPSTIKAEARNEIYKIRNQYSTFKLKQLDQNAPEQIVLEFLTHKRALQEIKPINYNPIIKTYQLLNFINLSIIFIITLLILIMRVPSLILSMIYMVLGISSIIILILANFSNKKKQTLFVLPNSIIMFLSVILFWNGPVELQINPTISLILSYIFCIGSIMLDFIKIDKKALKINLINQKKIKSDKNKRN